jgi:hypothetical protein
LNYKVLSAAEAVKLLLELGSGVVVAMGRGIAVDTEQNGGRRKRQSNEPTTVSEQ